MAEKIADIYAEVDARTGKYDRKMGMVKKTALGIGGVMAGVGGAIAAGFAVKKISDFSAAMIGLSADAEETANKFNVVFGESAGSVREWSKSVENSFGGTQTEVESWLSAVQDTLVPMGMARDEAAELSKQVVTLAGDLGSFRNEKTGDVLNNLQSAMMGMHRAGLSVGVVLRQTDVDMRAMAMTGKTSASELTDLEKMLARVQIMTEQSADANGDWARTMDSLANRTKIMQKGFGDLKITIGEALRQFFDAEGVVKMLGDAFSAFNSKLRELIDEGFFIKLSENFKAFFKIAWVVIEPLIKLVRALANELRSLLELLGKSVGKTFLDGLDVLYGGKISDILDERDANIQARLDALKEKNKAEVAAAAGEGVSGATAAAKEDQKERQRQETQFGGLKDILTKAQSAVDQKRQKLDEDRNKLLKRVAEGVEARPAQQPVLV